MDFDFLGDLEDLLLDDFGVWELIKIRLKWYFVKFKINGEV